MAYLLHIESTSTVCSVAISNNDKLIAVKELNNGYTHAENVHVFIQQLLKEQHISVSELKAISVSSGPGSYTGLRIGFSTAKGLAYALNIPLISVDTLKSLCVLVKDRTTTEAVLVPMTDARRMEVYCAGYDTFLKPVFAPKALILNEESIRQFSFDTPVYFFGDGMPKAKTLLLQIINGHFIDNILPSAVALIPIAFQKFLAKDFEDMAYSEPYYLKNFFFQSSQK